MSEMQVSVENVGPLNRRLKVIVPSHQLEQQKKIHLAEVTKKTRLDGFRPGKVPMNVVERLYGESIWDDVYRKSLSTTLAEAFQKNGLNPVGQPHIDEIKAVPGADLEYTATFEVYPQVLVPELKTESLEKLKVEITEDDIANVLEKIRHQHADWNEVERKAQKGDKVSFDLFPSDGSEPRKDAELVLEADKMPKEFECLLGSMAGETLNVSFPNAKKDASTGADLSARLEVKQVFEATLAELDDTLAQRLGVREGGIQMVRTQIREHMQIELDRVLREKLKTQVIDKLLQTHAIEVLPQTLLDQEVQRLETELQEQQKRQGVTNPEPLSEESKKSLQAAANRRVTLGLLLKALIETHQLQADEERVAKEVEALVSAFQFGHEMKEQVYKNEDMMTNIRSSVLEEQAIDKLLEDAAYTEKTMNYSELMNLSAATQEASTEETTA